MPQLIRGRVCKNDNIALGQVSGVENTMGAGAVPPAPSNENMNLQTGLLPYAQQVVADGAVAYWRLQEASGSTAVEQISGVNGTISGGVTYRVPGPIPGVYAMRFDGSTGRMFAPTGAYQTYGTGPFSLEFWVYQTALATARCFVNQKNLDGTVSPGLQINSDGTLPNALTLYLVDSTNTAAAQRQFLAALVTGVWQHFVVVLTRGVNDQLDLYRNGVLLSSASAQVVTGRSYVSTLGLNVSGDTAGALPAAGDFANVAIYQTALTPAQITSHYYAGLNTGIYGSENIRVGQPGPDPEVP